MPCVDCVVSVPIKRTPRVLQLEGMFDVSPAERSEVRWEAHVPFEEREWSIGLIVGPSGCGKSTLARKLFGKAMVEGFDWPRDKSIIEAFPKGMGIKEITGLLSSVGFSSPPSWLRPFRVLSTGQQFRVTIARALAENPELAVIDEFTSVVDRTVAQVGSAAVAKAVRRSGKKLVAVACHYDIIEWLDPDWVYEPDGDRFHWRLERRRPPIVLEIARVDRSAWQLFKQHHYLTASLSRAARCFVGFVMGQPAVFSSTIHKPDRGGGHWSEHRTVCLPDFQGVGIGNAMSEYVASLMRTTGKRYCSTSSNPAMISHRFRSPNWRCIRKPGMKQPHTDAKGCGLRNTGSHTRITAGFRYVGPTLPEDAEAFGLVSRPARGLVVRDTESAAQSDADCRGPSNTDQSPTGSGVDQKQAARPRGPRRRSERRRGGQADKRCRANRTAAAPVGASGD